MTDSKTTASLTVSELQATRYSAEGDPQWEALQYIFNSTVNFSYNCLFPNFSHLENTSRSSRCTATEYRLYVVCLFIMSYQKG